MNENKPSLDPEELKLRSKSGVTLSIGRLPQ